MQTPCNILFVIVDGKLKYHESFEVTFATNFYSVIFWCDFIVDFTTTITSCSPYHTFAIYLGTLFFAPTANGGISEFLQSTTQHWALKMSHFNYVRREQGHSHKDIWPQMLNFFVSRLIYHAISFSLRKCWPLDF